MFLFLFFISQKQMRPLFSFFISSETKETPFSCFNFVSIKNVDILILKYE